MQELLTNVIFEDIIKYSEKLEEYKKEKSEIIGDVKKVEKLKKLVAKADIEGVEISIPIAEDKSIQLQEIEDNITICKSIIRRLQTVCKMYDIDISDNEIIEE